MSSASVEIIGWVGSVVLLITLAAQTLRQTRVRSVEAVSPWLFMGQMVASATFLTYSVLIHNPVFIFTNALLIAAAGLGQLVLWRRRKGAPGRGRGL